MLKTTNKQQIEILLNSMQTNSDIARNFCKRSKEEQQMFWQNLESKLNSAGPPMKTVSDWKKVWSDQKKYVRQKAAQNLKASKGTGGGPNLERKFSDTEQAIYNLIGMQESVEGVAKKFGLNSSTMKKQADENLSTTLDEVLLEEICVVVDEDACVEIDEDTFDQPPVKKQKREQDKPPTQKSSPADVLAEELRVQKDICEVMKEQQQNSKKTYRSIDRLYDLQKQHFKTMEKAKKEELTEQKRHNYVMETLKLKQVEYMLEKKVKELQEWKAK